MSLDSDDWTGISGLEALELLLCQDNELRQLPNSIVECKNIEEIYAQVVHRHHPVRLPISTSSLLRRYGFYFLLQFLRMIITWMHWENAAEGRKLLNRENNAFSEVSKWCAPESLNFLPRPWMQGNVLIKLPEGLGTLPRLTKLFVTANKLQALPYSLGEYLVTRGESIGRDIVTCDILSMIMQTLL